MIDFVIDKIQKEKIIAIVRNVSRDKLLPLVKALYNGGIRLVECTFDACGKTTDEQISSNIELLVKHFGNDMIFGAGTVLTEEQVVLTKKAGGRFIISPNTNIEVIRKTKNENLVSIPGAFTPSEIVSAVMAGADFVKIFPVNSVGSKYIKAILAPLSNVKALAVGGVNTENVEEFLQAGICGIGVGSEIVLKDSLNRNAYDEITECARIYVEKVKGNI